MSQLSVISNGGMLIRNGVIEEVGPSRRIENLATARNAIEIDASGRVVMPGFVDPDVVLISPPRRKRDDGTMADDTAAVRLTSRKNLEIQASLVAAERARYGCLTAGANTSCAADLRSIVKVLRAHRTVQAKPLRIRSVFSYCDSDLDQFTSRWLPAVRKTKLAAVIDFEPDDTGRPDTVYRAPAIAASAAGFAIRFRSAKTPDPSFLLLALSAGAIAIVSPIDTLNAFTGRLAGIGCVRVIPASSGLNNDDSAASVRLAIGGGAALALTPSYRAHQVSTFNMQYMLYLAVEHFGMTPEEAIIATTYNSACSLRVSHVTGSLELGKSADLLMMDVDDYRELPRRAGHYDVSMVMRGGQILSRRSPLMLD
jgi:imidazolonepropionase